MKKWSMPSTTESRLIGQIIIGNLFKQKEKSALLYANNKKLHTQVLLSLKPNSDWTKTNRKIQKNLKSESLKQ